MKDLVSILIPTYNQEQFTAETLDSVINQSYKKLEIIIADDCSTDGTVEILKKYAAKDNRIKLLLSEQNQGIPANFNRAFDAVSGEFVAFLGGDDLMLPTKIEKQVSFLVNNPKVVLVQSDMEVFDSETRQKLYNLSDKGKIPTHPLEWGLLVDWNFDKGLVGTLPSSCLARSAYYCSGKYDDRFYLKHELVFTVECYYNFPEGEWAVIPEVLGKYRIHSSNFSQSEEASNKIIEESLLQAAVVKEKFPALAEKADEFEFFVVFKNLMFNLSEDPEVKRRLNSIFNQHSSALQKFTLIFAKVLAKRNLHGIYIRMNKMFKIFG